MSRDYRARETQSWLRAGPDGLERAAPGRAAPRARSARTCSRSWPTTSTRRSAPSTSPKATAASAASPATRFRPAPRASCCARATACSARRRKRIAPLHVTRRARRLPAGRVQPRPRHAARRCSIAPASVDGVVQAVVELGFFRRVGPTDQRAARRASPSRSASRCARRRTAPGSRSCSRRRSGRPRSCRRSRRSCASATRSSRSRAARCKESQARLETQQAELEQTNAQLEEQTQLLERQNDDLSQRAGGADREGRRARARQPVQERVPRQHEPRAAHAAQLAR